MLNKYKYLSDQKLLEEHDRIKHLKNIFSFNDAQARRTAESDFCFIEAEMIRRKLDLKTRKEIDG